MRDRLATAPWWVLSLVTGVFFGAFMFGLQVVQRGTAHLSAALVGAAVGAVIFGGIMGPVTARLNESARSVMGSVPHARTRTVRRASRRGPIPVDPRERAAAAGLASLQLDLLRRVRVPGMVLCAVFFVLAAVLAIGSEPWWWLGCGGATAAGALYWWWPRRVERRVELLTQTQAGE